MGKVYSGGVILPTGFKMSDITPLRDDAVVEFITDLVALDFQFDGMTSYVLEDQNQYIRKSGVWVINGGALSELREIIYTVTLSDIGAADWDDDVEDKLQAYNLANRAPADSGVVYTYVIDDEEAVVNPNGLVLTTEGTSGEATLVGKTLNIPNYEGGDVDGFIPLLGTEVGSPVTGDLEIKPYESIKIYSRDVDGNETNINIGNLDDIGIALRHKYNDVEGGVNVKYNQVDIQYPGESKGIVGNTLFDKAGDPNAFAQMGDIISSGLDVTALHQTGNETFTGIKSATNTGNTQINGLNLTNNGTTSNSKSVAISNTSSGIGIDIQNTGNFASAGINVYNEYGYILKAINTTYGQGIDVTNNSLNNGIRVTNNSTGVGIQAFNKTTGSGFTSTGYSSGSNFVAVFQAAGTGFNFEGKNLTTTTFSVNKTGDVTGNSFIKSGGTGTQYLMADGTTSISKIGTVAPASSSDTGTVGEIRVVAGYIYWCTAPNTWIRAAGTTF